MPKLDFVKYLSEDTDPKEREWFMEGYRGDDPHKERPDLGLGYRLIGSVMEWAQPKKAMARRAGNLTRQMEDPIEMGMGFMPAITMGRAGTSGMSKAFRLAEEGKLTKTGKSIAKRVRRNLENTKLWQQHPHETGVSGRFLRPKKQPPGEIPQGVKMGWSAEMLEGEADFLAQLEKISKAQPGEGYKIMRSDPVFRKYAPKWSNPLAAESRGPYPQSAGNPAQTGQEFLGQTIEEAIPSGAIKLKPIAEQRKMWIKFSSGVREFVEHVEGKYKIRIRDLGRSNVGIKKDGTPIFYDFGINEVMEKNFFKGPPGYYGQPTWTEPSTKAYWQQTLQNLAGEFSPAATPSFDLPLAANLGKRKFTSSQLKGSDFWKKLGDKPKELDLEVMAGGPSKIRPAGAESISESEVEAMTAVLKRPSPSPGSTGYKEWRK